jgi:hypothetical protein
LVDLTKQGLGKQDLMLGLQNQMLEKQDQMLNLQNQMLKKQDDLVDKMDETKNEIAGEIRELRSDLKSIWMTGSHVSKAMWLKSRPRLAFKPPFA